MKSVFTATAARARAIRLVDDEPGPASGTPWWLVAVAAVPVAVLVMGVAGLLVVAAAYVAWTHTRRHLERAAVARRRASQLPEALERMASALRTGSSLSQALEEAASGTEPPLGDELAAMAREANRGGSVADVLDRWVVAHRDHGSRLAATAMTLAVTVGSNPARALDGVAVTLRERLELAAERRAQATQGRASAMVLSLAPVGFAVLLGATDGAAAHFLLRTPAGWVCLVVGVGLDIAGAVWMARLTRSGAA